MINHTLNLIKSILIVVMDIKLLVMMINTASLFKFIQEKMFGEVEYRKKKQKRARHLLSRLPVFYWLAV